MNRRQPPEPPAAPAAQWRVRFFVSLLLGAGLLMAVSRFIDIVPDLKADPRGLALFGVATVPFLWLRAVRWHWLLMPLGTSPVRTSTLMGLAGTMWIVALPLRLGEFARPLFAAQKTDIPAARALGAVAIERVVDGLVVCCLFFACVGVTDSQGSTADELLPWGAAASGLMGTALLVLIGMARWPEGFGRMVTTPLRWVLPPLAEKVEGLARDIATGLSGLAPRYFLPFFIATLACWGTNLVGMWVLAHAVGLQLELVQAGAVLAVLNLTLLIPGGPAQFGNFHLGVALGLGLYLDITGVESIRAAGSNYVFYIYAVQLTGIVLGGLWAQNRLALDWRAMFRRGSNA